MKSFLFILTRFHHDYIDILNQLPIDKYIIYDYPPDDSFYIDQGFYNLTQTIKQPSAWDKSFYYLYINNLIDKYNYFYFIEDDVYTKDISSIRYSIKLLDNYHYDLISTLISSKSSSEKWCWWRRDKITHTLFNNPHKSFNPFCRLSSILIKKVLQFREKYNKFCFHEILFPSICVDNNLSMFDYVELIPSYFGTMCWRPVISTTNIIDNKIYHPVKDHIRLKESLDI